MEKDCKKCVFADEYKNKKGEVLLICSSEAPEEGEEGGLRLYAEVSNFDPKYCMDFKAVQTVHGGFFKMEYWKEIKPWEEAPWSEYREYTNTEAEQAQRMEGHLGPELNRRLEIAAAKLELLENIKKTCNRKVEMYEQLMNTFARNCVLYAYRDIIRYLKALEQEIKAELK